MAKACCSTNRRTIRRTPDWCIGQSPSYLAHFKNAASLKLKDAERCKDITPATIEQIVPLVTHA
jgi:hypothetical protein